jgi:hypothetical protein
MEMKFKTLMIIKAVVCLVFGFLFLFFPEALFGFMGATLGAVGLITAREYGAALAGNMLLTWYAKDSEDSIARRAIIKGMVLYNGIGFIVITFYTLNGTLNWLGWGPVAVYLFFTLGFGYFWLKKSSNA